MKIYCKYKKRSVLFLLVLFMLMIPLTSSYDASAAKKESSLDELEQKRKETMKDIKNLKNSIGNVQKNIDRLTTEKNTIQQYITDLDKEISQLTKQIEKFEGKIGEKEEDIRQTKEELEKAKIACDKQYDFMKQRIQFVYENPAESVFELLCSSGSIAEFLNRADNVNELSKYDRQMMDKLTELKEQIALEEERLEAELAELQMMKDEVAAQKKRQIHRSIVRRVN